MQVETFGRGRMRLRRRTRQQSEPDLIGGFFDVIKGIARGIKGGVQGGKAANAPVVKIPAKKVVKKPIDKNILFAGVGIAALLLFVTSKKRRKL